MSNSNGKYSCQDSKSLDEEVENDFAGVEFLTHASPEPIMSCKLQNPQFTDPDGEEKKEEEKEDCNFTQLRIEKTERNYTYEWSQSSGIAADANEDTTNLIEVVAGDKEEAAATVTISKPDLVGPCTSGKTHKGKSWDLECKNATDDGKVELKVCAKESNWRQLDFYMPARISGREYPIKAIKCGGWRRVTVAAYPDTELSLDGQFAFLKGSVSLDEDEVNVAGSKNTRELNLELKRNGKQVFKTDLFKTKIGKALKASEHEGDFSKTYKYKLNEAKKQSSPSDSDAKKEELKFLEIFAMLENLVDKFEKFNRIKGDVLGNFKKARPNSLDFELDFMVFSGKIAAKWIEVPNSRYCDYEVNGSLSIDPIFKLKFSWDFTNKLGAIPYLGPAVVITKGFLKTFDLGDVALKLECNGDIGLKSTPIKLRKRGIGDKELRKDKVLTLSGEVGLTLKALAHGKMQADIFFVKMGGEAHAEAGLRAKFADSARLYDQLKAARESQLKKAKSRKEQRELKKKLKGLESYKKPESRESVLKFQNDNLVCAAKIGFSGFQVYTITYAQLSVAVTHSNQQSAPLYRQRGKVVTETTNESGTDRSFGKTFSKGSKDEVVHGIVLDKVVMWEPEITIL